MKEIILPPSENILLTSENSKEFLKYSQEFLSPVYPNFDKDIDKMKIDILDKKIEDSLEDVLKESKPEVSARAFTRIGMIQSTPVSVNDFEGDTFATISIDDGVASKYHATDRVYSSKYSGPKKDNPYDVDVYIPYQVIAVVNSYIDREGCKYGAIKSLLEIEDDSLDALRAREQAIEEISQCIAKALCLSIAFSLRDNNLNDIIVNLLTRMENNEEIKM